MLHFRQAEKNCDLICCITFIIQRTVILQLTSEQTVVARLCTSTPGLPMKESLLLSRIQIMSGLCEGESTEAVLKKNGIIQKYLLQ